MEERAIKRRLRVRWLGAMAQGSLSLAISSRMPRRDRSK